jgi:hypothetical protein
MNWQDGYMAGMVRVGIIVRGGLIGLMLAAYGCRSESGRASGVQTEPAAAVVETQEDKTGSQETQPSAAGAQAQQDQGAESKPDESKPPVDLTLRFSPGAAATYRAVVEQGKSVVWQGAASTRPAGFEDGRTDNRIEMTFGQEVQTVDAVGDAAVKITIQALKYLNRVHNKVSLDFDSTRPADQENPLARLVGQSYQIKLSRRGDVLAIVEATEARSAVPASSAAFAMAQRLLSEDGIRERHTIPALAALSEGQVRPGQSWADTKSFSFSWMGSKSFERLYSLREVSEGDGGRLAVVEMKAIPAAGQAQGPQAMGPFAGAFDNTSNYDGRFIFELENGRVREYSEQMRTEWLVPDPEAIRGKADPAAVKMAASWLRRIELVK